MDYSALDSNMQALQSKIDSLVMVQTTLRIPLALRMLIIELQCVICRSVIQTHAESMALTIS